MPQADDALSVRLVPALEEAALAALVAFALFSLTLGFRTTDSVLGLTLTPRLGLLGIAVGAVFVGRLLISLFGAGVVGAVATRLLIKLLGQPVADEFIERISISRVVVKPVRVFGARFAGAIVGGDWSVTAYAGTALIAAAVCLPIALFAINTVFGLGLPLGYWFNLSILVLTYVMLGWGLNIVVGLAGLLDLGYVAFYAVGAYTFALLAQNFGLSFWECLPIAGLFAACWGIALGFPVLRLRGDYLAIVTLAFGEMIKIVLLNWYTVTGGPNGVGNIPRPTFFGLSFQANEQPNFHSFFGLSADPLHRVLFLYYVILVLALITNAVTLRLRRLPIGRAWEALREDEIACRSLGLNTTTVKLSAFATGAMFAGFAGSFFATRQGFISPESFTFIESAIILAIVVLGGMGSQVGVVIAAVVLIGGFEFLRDTSGLQVVFGAGFDPSLYRMLIFGLAMVAIMVWRPRGLVSTRKPTVGLQERRIISADLVREGRG